MRPTAALFTHEYFRTPFAKTAHGLVRGPSRYEIVALVDRVSAGKDAGAELDGRPRGIPTFATLPEMFERLGRRPDHVIVGIATSGGVLPPEMKLLLLDVVRRGVGVVNGLHEFLSDDAAFVAAAAESGARIVDVRKPKPRRELHFWSGAIRSVRAPRIAVLGTDCALGKRTTCHVLVSACREAGLAAAIVHTGQTGWLQGIAHGFVLDTTPNDFVSGELEHAVVECDRDLSPAVIFLEGQSGLLNPSGPCGAELLLSAEARGVVLQHAPGRRFHEDQELLENEIAPLAKQIALIGMYGARVLAISLNDEGVEPAARESVRSAVERETGLPAFWPLHEGASRAMPALRAFLGSTERR
ncbi:MAG: DUF1611 domain-containing protein [Planctomycetota bacterium]|nr:DUF1611 domain-containing protein [Planctomycetota bacterium]